jgi:hypothetical protein
MMSPEIKERGIDLMSPIWHVLDLIPPGKRIPGHFNRAIATEADLAKFHVVLFGDPGSNKWIAKLNGPALIYPNPLNPAKYVVLNTGLTIEDRGYNGDYGTPLWGDYAIVKAKEGAEVPDLLSAGLFDENWKLARLSAEHWAGLLNSMNVSPAGRPRLRT